MTKNPKTRRKSTPALLTTSGLAKRYGDLDALVPLDLKVVTGERVVLVGHNGSGKSTLLRMMAGILEPTEGGVSIDGAPAGSLEARAVTSFLPDEPVLYDDLSVREHVDYIGRLHGTDGYGPAEEAIADRLGLVDRIDDLPARFSRGLRQKTALLLGLTRPCELLLVDEPFVGLDLGGKQALVELLEERHQAGATLLVATHDPEFADRVDRCVALRDGEVTFDGQASGADIPRLVSA
jgi:ABC-type multidrug transport system ATPase subunit